MEILPTCGRVDECHHLEPRVIRKLEKTAWDSVCQSWVDFHLCLKIELNFSRAFLILQFNIESIACWVCRAIYSLQSMYVLGSACHDLIFWDRKLKHEMFFFSPLNKFLTAV